MMFEIARRLYSAKDIFVLLVLQPAPAAPITANCAETLTPSQKLSFEIYKELDRDRYHHRYGRARPERHGGSNGRGGLCRSQTFKFLTGAPKKGNLVARLRGTGARGPLLLLAHLDVVPASREDWSVRSVQTDGTGWLFLWPRYRGRQVPWRPPSSPI